MSVATVSQNAFVDAANSSTTALGAAGTFTGRAEDVSIYAAVNVFAFTDQAGTLFVEFSVDGTNWDKSNSYVVSASTANSQSLAPPAQFVRVRYVNGATPQTSFRLQTFYQPISPAAASTAMGTVTANQGTAGALAGGWPVKITDGVSVLGTGTDPVRTDPTGTTTQPVSAVSLPLPSGAATAANQTTLGSQTTKINDGTTTVAVTLANALKVDGSAVTQPVSAASLPLPAGAATEATLATRLADATFTARINTLGQNTMAASTPIVIASDQSAVPISAASLPLPSGAATAANQTTLGSQTTKINDGTTTVAVTLANALKVDGSAVTQPVSGTVTANIGTSGALALDATLTGGTQKTRITDGTNDAAVSAANALKVDGSAVTQPVSVASLPLPAGAATAANQTTLGNQTSKINDGTTTVAVTLANALKVDGSAVTQPVSGTVTANIGTSGALALDATLTGGTQTSRLTDGTNTAAVSAANALKVDGSAVTQPISATTLPLPTGASQEHVTAASPHAVRLTDGAAFYDATKTGQLPTALVGARLDTNVGAWLGSTAPTVGQKTAANSLPTILASDQGALPVNVVGAHANAWNAVAVAAAGNSASIDCQYTPHISAFGTSNGNTTISLQVSQNDTDFYTAATVTVGGGGGDFALNLTIGARYIRLQSSAARTITASITGKD